MNIYHDVEYARLTVTAKTKQQALTIFKKTYGYCPKELEATPPKIKDNHLHRIWALAHEKSMGYSD